VNSDTSAKKAGLHMKLPFVDEVRRYDKRNQGFELDSQEIIAADQQRLIVDAIARYRIKDPLQFFRAAQDERNGRQQLRQRLVAALLNELGRVETPNIISGQRAQLMQRVRTSLGTGMAEFGVEIIDVRIRRADLPEANSERVFERMKSELQQKAAQFRAEGEEQFLTIKGDADKQAQVILAEAQQQSQTLRGEGDATRNAIYAEAYGRDAEFFSFYRSLEAYDKSIKEGTPLVISPDSEFFKYFGDSAGR
jgi:membrane protease subunit HflC